MSPFACLVCALLGYWMGYHHGYSKARSLWREAFTQWCAKRRDAQVGRKE